jgi:long-subunit fatty acid transport protein
LSNSNFSVENKLFESELESRGEIRLGTEWRFDNFSFRGGYNYEKSPYKNAKDSDNLEGFSVGAGYTFRGGRFDLSYQKYSNTAPYNIYGQYSDQVDSAELDYDISKFTATLVINI